MQVITKPIPKPGSEWGTGFELLHLAEPKLSSPDQVKIKVYASGVCGTDVSIYRSQQALAETMANVRAERVTIGHEFCGELADWGPAALKHLADLVTQRPYGNERINQFVVGRTAQQLVADTKFPTLLREEFYVTAEMHVTCGQCLQCTIGQRHLCQKTKVQGIHMDGSYAEFVVVPAEDVVLFAKGEIPPDIIAFMDAIGNGVHMMQSTDVVGRSLMITGCGVQGLASVAIAKKLGAGPIICTDALPEGALDKLAIAKQLGADAVFNMLIPGAKEALRAKVNELTNGNGVDVVFELSGNYRAYDDAFANLRLGGKLTLLGLPGGTYPLNFSQQVIFRGLTIHGVFGRRVFDSWHLMQELFSQGLGEVILQHGIITHRLPLEKYDEGFAALQNGKAIKVLLYPNGVPKK